MGFNYFYSTAMKNNRFDYIICGGGASGLLLLKELLADPYFENYQIALIEKEVKNSNDRTWCFWENQSSDFEDLLVTQWTKARFDSSSHSLEFSLAPYTYKMLRAEPFYRALYDSFSKFKQITLITAEIKSLNTFSDYTEVNTDKGTFISKFVLNSVFDPNILLNQKKYPVLQQHFVGWFVSTSTPCFDKNSIQFMDFSIPQLNETRFMYMLPISKTHALFEYTLFSAEKLAIEEYEQGIEFYLKRLGISTYQIEEKEYGSIPMTCFPFEKQNSPSLLHIGTAGGWTKASTGFTFKNTTRQVKKLVPFLKTHKPLNKFSSRNRFYYYDLLFLDVLFNYNAKGSELFERMFTKNSPQQIFRFLDEQTHFGEELKILSSYSLTQISWFLKALMKRLF